MIFLKVKNSYNKKLVTWLDLNLQVALKFIFNCYKISFEFFFKIETYFKIGYRPTKGFFFQQYLN